MSRFLQIHFLSSYPGALLNRDDAGFAKRLPFGGAVRTRISSQCLKRHWRTFQGENTLASLHEGALQGSIRSRLSFERFVLQPLINDDKVEPGLARMVVEALMDEVLGKSDKAKKADEGEAKKGKKKGDAPATTSAPEKKEAPLHTSQVTVLGRVELDYLRKEAKRICDKKPDEKELAGLVKEGRENFKALKKSASGLDAALFGRMVTGDILSRGDAAVHVAHAFTVHAEHTESDYFSAVDDLLQDTGELGAGHINATELTSGLYYGYVVVDVPLLLNNLAGIEQPKEIAAKIVEHLVHLIATVSPGAKLGSTAPYSCAQLLLLEAGNAQPRTLANAFLNAVKESQDLLSSTYQAMGTHLADLTQMYGKKNQAQLAGLGGTRLQPLLGALGIEKPTSIGELAQWAATQVRG